MSLPQVQELFCKMKKKKKKQVTVKTTATQQEEKIYFYKYCKMGFYSENPNYESYWD